MKFLLLILLSAPALAAENWPAWRGPHFDGTSTEKNIATKWDQKNGIAWRLELPGPGPSTPAIWGDRIFLTGAESPDESSDLNLICVDTSGKILWRKNMGSGNLNAFQGEANGASPSPVTDGKHVWVYYASGVLACFDFDGNEKWRVNVQELTNDFSLYFGMSASPMLDGDRLYFQLLHAKDQSVLALDKNTGKVVWRVKRESNAKKESLQSYVSPVIHRHDGDEFLLIHGSDHLTGHRLSDGKEIWRTGGFQKAKYNPMYRFVPTPVSVNGLIVVGSAKNGPVMGINPKGAKGDMTGKPGFQVWKMPDNTPDVPSPLVVDDLVYLCRENGILICLDAKTGEQIYRERLHSGRYRASIVYADGHLYMVCMDGVTSVVKAGRKFELVSENDLKEKTSASPAVSDGVLYIRTFKALYAIK